ncbi:GNAT family N-acetyltransferase [Egicoccus halophilus]|uniref:Acetyltransferase n=1 Tax=Egicoccus halophilus TaxID=1670830 RepID=A0A8J3ETJ7_9ACTN|nr:GNAT family N-acetyltransferase [Egicoccus halophilus]GGI05747.1 acetyltransferase [Egicoccus halophilus]
MSARLRAYAPADLPALRHVCVATGAAGRDATGTLPDVGILPDVYAEPYVVLEPSLATVVEDAAGQVVGYVLGTADTERFVAAWRARWLPVAASRHPAPDAVDHADQARLVRTLHTPESMRTRWVATHPAHLHVNLLPSARGRGLGRALLDRFTAAVAARGAGGVHLGVAADNPAAQAFYAALGYQCLGEDPGVVWFGRRLA